MHLDHGHSAPFETNAPFEASHYFTYLEQWLSNQNISPQDFKDYFSWDLKSLPDFSTLMDMSKSVERLLYAIQNQQKIAVYGDYDVDGTTSCALFYRFFQKIQYPVTLYQPSRFTQGYGLHPASVEKAMQDQIAVLITVDCGTTSLEAAERARELGLDLIITDHHKDSAPHLPNSFALINPNRRGHFTTPMQQLAGVGIAFAVCVCLRSALLKVGYKVSSLYDLLPLVAIGTISDVATLSPMNLILCRHGLKNMGNSTFTGLKKFLQNREFSTDYLDADLIGFFIGPMINSKGRLDHPEIALKLLTTDDVHEAQQCFDILSRSNSERKKIQQNVFDEAKKLAQQEISENEKLSAIVLYQPHWHEGVIGIVAAKLVEEFHRPALVFTASDQPHLIKASARTFYPIDIFQSLKTHEVFFKKFGGHKAAAGVTLPLDQFAAFKQAFLATIECPIATEQSLNSSITIDMNHINGKLLKTIYSLAPFGAGNPMPLWKIHGAKITHFEILKDLHVKWSIENINPSIAHFEKKCTGISFNYLRRHSLESLHQLVKAQTPVILTAKIKVNLFRGKAFLQLHVDAIELEKAKAESTLS